MVTGAADTLSMAVLFPELLGTYGDGGNVLVLQQRAAWRGLPVETVPVALGTPVPEGCDLYVLGGGEDQAQQVALEALRAGTGLQRAAGRGAPVLAVCAGLQMLGVSLTDRQGATTSGLGLLDLDTRWHRHRLIGEVLAVPTATPSLPTLTGFANHAGRSRLGAGAVPLAHVLAGPGSADGPAAPRDLLRRRSSAGAAGRTEGAVQGGILATYLHGPVLARNPDLADLLLSRALGRPLEALQQPEELVQRRETLGARGPRQRLRGRTGWRLR